VSAVTPMRRYDCMMALADMLDGDEPVIVSLGSSVDEWYSAAPHMRATRPFLIVAKVDPSVPQDIRRKHSDGREDKYIFVRHVEETEGIVIMGPSEHN